MKHRSVIYFAPAVSLGEMLEADVYCFVGLIFAFLACSGGLSLRQVLSCRLGDVTIVFWVGLCMGLVCWTKAYMFKPPFNVAATMASIVFFSV
jgi:hypothetical protein